MLKFEGKYKTESFVIWKGQNCIFASTLYVLYYNVQG